MRKLYFICLLLILVSNNISSQCYKSAYDIIEEKLCIKDGNFEFELIDPLDPNIIINGKFIKKKDTLIFNPKIKQTELIVSNSRLINYEQKGKFIKLTDNQKKPLAYLSVVINKNRLRTNKEGLIKIETDFPSEISIKVSTIHSQKMWANPYQKQLFKVETGYKPNDKSHKENLLIIELNLEKDFKTPFEHETKLLIRGEKLHYILNSGEVMDMHFNKM